MPDIAGTDSCAIRVPPHPVHASTTYELRDYRKQLERALGDHVIAHAPMAGKLQETLAGSWPRNNPALACSKRTEPANDRPPGSRLPQCRPETRARL